MKKILLPLFILFASFSAAPAWAVAPGPFSSYANFDAFETVDGDGSTTEKTTFGLNETPWLHVTLPDSPGGANSDYFTNWEGDFFFGNEHTERSFAGAGPESATVKDFWVQPVEWDLHKEVGNWSIAGFYAHSRNSDNVPEQYGIGHANFTVTPEPASLALFGLGAGLLGVLRIRRKKA